jgi:hypothetical protein
MPEVKKFSLIKPTLQTPFHIDFDWWRINDTNWHVGLQSLLCPEHQEAYAGLPEGQMIDWVDPETAEVRLLDGIQNSPGFSMNTPPWWMQSFVSCWLMGIPQLP